MEGQVPGVEPMYLLSVSTVTNRKTALSATHTLCECPVCIRLRQLAFMIIDRTKSHRALIVRSRIEYLVLSALQCIFKVFLTLEKKISSLNLKTFS